MANSRADQRDRIILEFGVWIQPYRELAKRAVPPDLRCYLVANGKLEGSAGEITKRLREYVHLADDVVVGSVKMRLDLLVSGFVQSLPGLLRQAEKCGDLAKLQATFKAKLDVFENEFMRLLNLVPVDWAPEIFEANTPFTAYLRIKSAMSTAQQRVDYFDRYLKKEFFPLFLYDLKRDLSIRLVTTEKGVADVEPVSNLARQEFSNYQLIKVNWKKLHDRNLRVDQLIFSLGPGVDRAGAALTNFGPSDSSSQAHNQFDQLIGTGIVVHHS